MEPRCPACGGLGLPIVYGLPGNELAEGVVHQIYSPDAAAGGAYAFNTPEAWNGYDTTTYRATYYARALAAWDMYASARSR